MTRKKETHLGRPKGATRDATTARVLRAARTCFARSGFAATTNREIAEEAGVTAATIYLYFESKTALYIATVRAAYDELLPHYSAATRAPSLPEAFRMVLAASAPLHKTDPSLAAFFSALPIEMRRHPELSAVIADEGRGVLSLFGELVELGVRNREISPAVAPHVLSLFIASTLGLSIYATAIDSSQFDGVLEVFAQLIAGTLFQPPRARPATTRRAAARRPAPRR